MLVVKAGDLDCCAIPLFLRLQFKVAFFLHLLVEYG